MIPCPREISCVLTTVLFMSVYVSIFISMCMCMCMSVIVDAAYKTGKKLDTTSIDDKYSNIVSGLPSTGVKGCDPFPVATMK